MALTHKQRAALEEAVREARRERIADTLRRTVKPATMSAALYRDTAGPDPWQTRCAPGQDIDLAHNHAPMVHLKRRTEGTA